MCLTWINRLLVWFSVALDFLGTLKLNLKFWYIYFPQAFKANASSSGGKQRVNDNIHSDKVTKKWKWNQENESGVLLPTFKTSRDKDDFKNISGSSRFCPPLLLHRPQVPPYWGQTTSSIKPQTCLLEQGRLLLPGFGRWWAMSNDVEVGFQGTGLVGLVDGSHLGKVLQPRLSQAVGDHNSLVSWNIHFRRDRYNLLASSHQKGRKLF